MCEECRQTPCHSRCPNSEEVGYETCSFCGEDIKEYDEFLEGYKDLLLHRECFENMSNKEIEEVFKLDSYTMRY